MTESCAKLSPDYLRMDPLFYDRPVVLLDNFHNSKKREYAEVIIMPKIKSVNQMNRDLRSNPAYPERMILTFIRQVESMYFPLIYLFVSAIDAIVLIEIHRFAQYKPNSSCAFLGNITLPPSASIQSCIWQCVQEVNCQTAVYSYNDKVCWMYDESCQSGSIQPSESNRSSVICYRKNQNLNMHCSSTVLSTQAEAETTMTNTNHNMTVIPIVIQASGTSVIDASAQYGCPTSVNVTAVGSAKIHNLFAVNLKSASKVDIICATGSINVKAADSTSLTVIRSNSTSLCPLVANIHAEALSEIYVCATQTINVIASSAALVYYYGSLNSSQTQALAQVTQRHHRQDIQELTFALTCITEDRTGHIGGVWKGGSRKWAESGCPSGSRSGTYNATLQRVGN
ncbi:hypothetical protein I4U23_027497 [Adineta vaga]|nr:hypothetical protein I4U23_027497 [Adineta vaga]